MGDIYLGHWKFAIVEILVAATVWLVFLIPDPNYPMTLYGRIVGAVIIVVLVHGADAHHPAPALRAFCVQPLGHG